MAQEYHLASEEDIPKIGKIYMFYFSHQLDDLLPQKNKFNFLKDYLFLRFLLHRDCFWVAYESGEIVGYIIAPIPQRFNPIMLIYGFFKILCHLIQGKYGFPQNLIKCFLRTGFSFYRSPSARKLTCFPHIYSIAVIKNKQGKGTGTKLMHLALSQHAEKGYRVSWLTVHSQNKKAIQFYRNLGYKTIKQEKNGDMIMMKILGKGDINE
ncbi:MAG: GNAT family N-acetyltransferase [Candidatus Hodarchaeota archaeon]